MIWFLLAAHLVGVVAVLALPAPKWAFGVALVAPAMTTVWASTRLGESDVDRAGVEWVQGLDLALRFRVGPLGALLALRLWPQAVGAPAGWRRASGPLPPSCVQQELTWKRKKMWLDS